MIEVGKSTDVGRTRPLNEDSYYVSEYVEQFDAIYAMVADGMGGHQAGEVASAAAIGEVSAFINKYFTDGLDDEQIKKLLVSAIKSANDKVYRLSRADEHMSGMGTTLTLLLKTGKQIYIAHVGDSRAYVIHGESIHRVTTDHSMVEELLKSGQITPKQAQNHPQKNIITRAIGTEPTISADTYQLSSQPGDIYLLCTDGLTNMLSDGRIISLIRENEHLDTAAKILTQAANEQGGQDNITVVLLRV